MNLIQDAFPVNSASIPSNKAEASAIKKQKTFLTAIPIPLETAIKQAANWRNYCHKLLNGEKGNHGEDLPVIKAFFIPLADLQEVIDLARDDSGKDVGGLRIYFRLENEDDDLSNLQAMIVPVIHEAAENYWKDWTHLHQLQGSGDSSLVFDFTKPCPTECDNDSPLSQ